MCGRGVVEAERGENVAYDRRYIGWQQRHRAGWPNLRLDNEAKRLPFLGLNVNRYAGPRRKKSPGRQLEYRTAKSDPKAIAIHDHGARKNLPRANRS
ncbi:MAG: hypothetical protein QGG73_05740, partial [Candidatus Hydrogenedentes bacterium]|nr:hypothetical protein [Candidatus Hydrogenedentota bacterium]